jgi:hypothetical protein
MRSYLNWKPCVRERTLRFVVFQDSTVEYFSVVRGLTSSPMQYFSVVLFQDSIVESLFTHNFVIFIWNFYLTWQLRGDDEPGPGGARGHGEQERRARSRRRHIHGRDLVEHSPRRAAGGRGESVADAAGGGGVAAKEEPPRRGAWLRWLVAGWLAGLACREKGGFGIAMQEPVHRLGACKGKWSGVWFPKKSRVASAAWAWSTR